ncbi:MAG: golvesin C-terminal-like domain-containing protein [Planctomycetales bacterium]
MQKVSYHRLQKRLLADGQVLQWAPTGSHRKLDGIVLDDHAAEFTGMWTKSNAQPAHIGSSYQHDGNQERGEKTAAFSPDIPTTGDYEIRLLYTTHENRSSMTAVTIRTGGKEQTVKVNQREPPRSLGVFGLQAGNPLKVIISNTGANGFVIVDGLQLKPLPHIDSTNR